MKTKDRHYHAHYRYSKLNLWDYIIAVLDLIIAKFLNSKSITFHLPVGVQFKSYLNNSNWVFVHRISKLSYYFSISCYWENTALCTVDTWKLKEQSNLLNIKGDVNICLDTGHLILGSDNIKDARKRILMFLKKYSNQIKHIHLHENDLIHDQHKKTGKIINKKLRNSLIKGRTYIDEIY